MPRPTKSTISEVMRHIGGKSAAKAGRARMAQLSPEQRRELGTKAANARWSRKKKKPAS